MIKTPVDAGSALDAVVRVELKRQKIQAPPLNTPPTEPLYRRPNICLLDGWPESSSLVRVLAWAVSLMAEKVKSKQEGE